MRTELSTRRQARLRQHPAEHYYFTKTHYLRLELEQRGYFLATPSAFNDPFDCDLRVLIRRIAEVSDADLAVLKERIASQARAEKTSQVASALVRKVEAGITFGPTPRTAATNFALETSSAVERRLDDLAQLSRTEDVGAFRSAAIDWLTELAPSIGIKCFTSRENWASGPMWAHYGGNHSHVCVGVYSPETLFAGWRYNVGHYSVDYTEQPIQISEAFSLKSLLQQFLTTKFLEWGYEHESRIISFRAQGYLRFRASSLREIILGPKWFDLPGSDSESTILKTRREFIELVYKFRKLQGLKKLRIYLTAIPAGGRYVERFEVPPGRLSFLLNAASQFRRSDMAFKYVLQQPYPD